MEQKKPTKPRFRVGDWVTLYRPPFRPLAQVIEYRGWFGKNAEHVYRLRRVFDWGEVREFEQPEWGLEPADAPAATG